MIDSLPALMSIIVAFLWMHPEQRRIWKTALSTHPIRGAVRRGHRYTAPYNRMELFIGQFWHKLLIMY